MDVIAEQIAAMSARVNAWLNFSLTCAWIGFALAVVAGIIYIKITKENVKNGKNNH